MMTYLDNAATAFRKPESVYKAMDKANRQFSVNAGRGSYALAREMAEKISETRLLLTEAADAKQGAEVVFTASATLAFNAIIGGLDWRRDNVVYVSPYEHNAVMRTLHGYREKYGFQVLELPLEKDLGIDIQKSAYLFAKTPPTHLFLNMVSNVTGYVLPAKQLCEEAAGYDCITVLDGAQAFGGIPVSLKDYRADFFVFAGHKALCGPFGIGGFVAMSGRKPAPVFYGGTGTDSLELGMPSGVTGLEPGSPNITAIAGLHAALLEIRHREVRQQLWEAEQLHICRFIEEIRDIPGLCLYLAPEKQLQAGILSVNLEGYLAQELGRILDEEFKIAVRAGYHCAPLIHKYLGEKEFAGTLRISIGRFTGAEELRRIKEALQEIAEG